MKFETIMREAGVCTRHFAEKGAINVVLYDDENRIVEDSDVHFNRTLFADNPDSFDKFFTFVENMSDYGTMNIKITAEHVIVNYQTSHAIVFPRKPAIGSMDPLDYMDSIG